jgi:hypothetical protein
MIASKANQPESSQSLLSGIADVTDLGPRSFVIRDKNRVNLSTTMFRPHAQHVRAKDGSNNSTPRRLSTSYDNAARI